MNQSAVVLQLPCSECKLTFNTIRAYHRHLHGGYYGNIPGSCKDIYDHTEALLDLEEINIERIDKQYPTDYIDLDSVCVFGNERTNSTIVLIDENDTCLTGTVMLYNDSLNDIPVISIHPTESTTNDYLFAMISQYQNHIYYLCKNTDMVDLDRIKKMQILNLTLPQQYSYVKSCSALYSAMNLLIHGESS